MSLGLQNISFSKTIYNTRVSHWYYEFFRVLITELKLVFQLFLLL